MPSPFCRSAPIGLLVVAVVGCATAPQNPSFHLAAPDARKELREMRQSQRALARPVVIVHGLGPPVGSRAIEHELRRVTGDDRILTVSYDYLGPFEHARRQLVEQVEKRFPAEDPAETREVDVVAISMGGLVARYAAAPPEGSAGKRLKVARLFTISTPHRGAVMAALPAVLGRTQLDLRKHSAFLRDLAEREAKAPPYEVVPYARLGDCIVGEHNAAPEGMTPLWVPNLLLEGSHLLAFSDPRIVGDIARRLRGEAPFAAEPAEPLPRG
jgi:pimeloyl-ACP methyl ester carboxylesterase